MPDRKYKLGSEYPAEHFVQMSIENHFSARGFSLDTGSHVDLICVHPDTGERWHIEAKGVTSNCSLDFKTCLGQLIQRMQDGTSKHAIAVPDDPRYLAQVAQVSQWVVDRLSIHWLVVGKDGSVRITAPHLAADR